MAKLTIELEYAGQDRDRNKRDLIQRSNLLKLREDEIIKLRQENVKLCKAQENSVRKCATIEECRRELEQQIIILKTQFGTQDKEVEGMHRLIEHLNKEKENLTKDRDNLKHELLLEQKAREKSDALFQESQFEIKKLKDSINQMMVKHNKLSEDLKKSKKEKSKKIEEIQAVMDKVDTLQNEIDLKHNYEKELKRTISDIEAKCTKLQAQHDIILKEKNSLQRNIQALEDERTKLKDQLINVQSSVQTMRDKLGLREADIGKLQLHIDRLEKERRMLKSNVQNAQLNHQHTKAELLEKKKENDMFTRSLQEDEHKFTRLKLDHDKLLKEKNSLNVSLIKRNNEYIKLKNEHDLLQTTYEQKCQQLQEYEDEVRSKSVIITNLTTDCNILRQDREASNDLRNELMQMHRKLNQERLKAKALLEEMTTPMNIHRWRNLGGTDPERMTLIKQNQELKKYK